MDLIRRFGERTGGSVFEKLATLKQEDSIEEYVRGFEILVAQVGSMPKEQILEFFLGGLRPEIRSKVRIHDPREISKAIELACDLEEDLRLTEDGGGPRSRGNSFSSAHLSYRSLPGSTTIIKTNSPVSFTGSNMSKTRFPVEQKGLLGVGPQLIRDLTQGVILRLII